MTSEKNKILTFLTISIFSLVCSLLTWKLLRSDEACSIHLYAGMSTSDVIRLCGHPKSKRAAIVNREDVERWYYSKLIVDIDGESKLVDYEISE